MRRGKRSQLLAVARELAVNVISMPKKGKNIHILSFHPSSSRRPLHLCALIRRSTVRGTCMLPPPASLPLFKRQIPTCLALASFSWSRVDLCRTGRVCGRVWCARDAMGALTWMICCVDFEVLGTGRAYSSAQEERNPRETALPATMVGGPRRRRDFFRLGP